MNFIKWGNINLINDATCMYIEIMTKSCGAEGRNIVTFTVHVFCTYVDLQNAL